MHETENAASTGHDRQQDRSSSPRLVTSDAARYVIAAFGISWLLWAPMVVLGDFTGAQLLGFAGSFGPLVAAGLVIRRRHGTLEPLWRPILRWRVGLRWYVIALGGPAAAIALAAAVARGLGADDGVHPAGWAALPALLAFSLVVGGGQEEPGWRGVAQPALQNRFNGLSSALIVGGAWALWHLPLFVIPGTSQEGLHLGAFLIYAPGLAIVLAWLYNATAGSVLICVVAHAAANAATVAAYPIAGLASHLILAATVWALALIALWSGGRNLAAPPTLAVSSHRGVDRRE